MNIAFIPLRGGSKSIPLKNIKIINGRPLVYWTLDAAVNCKNIQKVVVSTDSLEIKNCVEHYNSKKIIVVGRSQETATDTASTESAMLEYAHNNNFKLIVLIQATSPLLKAEELEKALDKFNENKATSLLSVVRQKRFIWKEQGQFVSPINYDYLNRPRRQDFKGSLIENGAFYITSRDDLLMSKNRLSGDISYYEMDEESYFELDEPRDWGVIEQLLKKRNLNENNTYGKIKMLITDNDGVMTDGGMYYSSNGDELKKYNTKDGMAFELLRKHDILTGIITGENNNCVMQRAIKLKVDELHMGIKDKILIINKICKKYNFKYENIAYVGDDINDYDVIKNVGFGCCVNDGMEKVKQIAKYVTQANGGQGAVREVVELILNNI